jgi:low affinity Fe/Cu permease
MRSDTAQRSAASSRRSAENADSANIIKTAQRAESPPLTFCSGARQVPYSFESQDQTMKKMPLTNEASPALGSMPDTSSATYAKHSTLLSAFDRFASRGTRWAGSPMAFCLALTIVLVWAISGPVFKYSEDWQLVINTGTTIVTFLMVFLIQQSQNKDSVALHLKLNELLAANRSASNRMIGIEDLDEQDLREIAEFYSRLATRAKAAGGAKEQHSIDEQGMP